ncbi:glucose 1-dehydrogenase [Solirhodobacter olei]|uniref:glucose 1-dehydrogenase n=1 Tax=Solirhodobacter olei TaxID=2493082 RepID=UPI000FD703C6|nr:glucose 1-dehydrogenase [Solirhodobacter olei]
MADRVKEKVALVTGARRGLGAAIAAMLAREGAKVVLTDRKAEGSNEVVKEIVDAGGEAIFLEHDVTRPEDWDRVISETVKRFGKLSILVNNAGVGAGMDIEAVTLEEWRWVMGINLEGTMLGTQRGISAMKKTGGGSIVNISSIEGLVGDSRMVAYDSSKAGIVLLSRSAALYCAEEKYNIRVNTVHPGFIDTKMVGGFLEHIARDINKDGDVERARRELEERHPLGHLGEPDDVAYAVLYLASDEAKFATGTELVIDGGYTAQ